MSTDRITDLAEKWGTAAVEAIGRHGPEAVQLAETVARLDAIRTLIVSGGFVGLGSFGGLWVMRRIKAHIAEVKVAEGPTYEIYDTNPLIVIGGGVALLFAAVSVVGGLSDLLNPLAWAGAFEPKVWIAAKLLKL